ncbi:MMPL family transporter [Streptomyces coelicoflavus]|uniref:MMPL family transporter n=1 Tax=Streptomyces coelicoflavus TaxID=285562 RepID=UPI00368B3675
MAGPAATYAHTLDSYGHLQWLVGDFTVTGRTDVTTPILMFCIIFGLSMEYEVFLLSRIKEEYDRTGDNPAAVAAGLESTGRIVSAAAGLLAIFFLALVSAGVTHVKMLGLGTALAILMDALVIGGCSCRPSCGWPDGPTGGPRAAAAPPRKDRLQPWPVHW